MPSARASSGRRGLTSGGVTAGGGWVALGSARGARAREPAVSRGRLGVDCLGFAFGMAPYQSAARP